ncbi:MAG: alanine--tRNA ligase [Phycisphaerales bacterium]|nr:alanine--tRNA ligase [Phycisphaerales bacterium]
MPRTLSAAEIRKSFIDFFTERAGHAHIPSSPVIPHDDPTLLFINAGMNQFKDVFLGLGTRDCTRAVNSQKCIRAGGKHNDLEDVGLDTYHHTFFEMLGNWSFGDYFKREAITWAWQLLTEVWELDPNRLHVTVFAGDEADGTKGDEEAEALWLELTDVNPDHITRWGKKDNFWEMGATGPCGPCSEIHYDNTPDGKGGHLVNLDHPNVIEFWNLVFIEFNRRDDGTLVPLPSKHIDTGMGLERIARIIQGVGSNYDTDLWTPIFEAIRTQSGVHPYGGTFDDPIDTAYRVIADHARCLVIAITDGGRPGNEGRGYVLRRILRRAVRMASQILQVEGPMLHALVPAVVSELEGAFPELSQQTDAVAEIIRQEEEAFLKTLQRGLQRFAAAAATADDAGEKTIAGDVAFQLHDTFGFPIDLTEVMAAERGMQVDREGYEALMETARVTSRSGDQADAGMVLPPDALGSLGSLNVHPTNDDAKYGDPRSSAMIKAIWNGHAFCDHTTDCDQAGIVLDHTNFYAEQGGQVADTGLIISEAAGSATFKVDHVQRFGDYVLHRGQSSDHPLQVGDRLMLHVDESRRSRIESNHTTTHLLNHALRAVLGAEVEQRGSLVADDRLRFDFSHASAMTPEELAQVEDRIRNAIQADLVVEAREVALHEAESIAGVRAVFGERYPDPVRVVSIGAPVDELLARPLDESWNGYSIEFCGGTHLDSTAGAGNALLISEQGLAAGIRRITAVTGDAAREAHAAGTDLLEQARTMASLEGEALLSMHESINSGIEQAALGAVHRHEILSTIEQQRDRIRAARKERSSAGVADALAEARTIAQEASGPVIVGTLHCDGRDSLMSALDLVRAKHEESACMLLAATDGGTKVAIVARVPESLIARGLKAGDWVREAATACGGKGGGRPDMAQAGGRDPEKIQDAAEIASTFAHERLS